MWIHFVGIHSHRIKLQMIDEQDSVPPTTHGALLLCCCRTVKACAMDNTLNLNISDNIELFLLLFVQTGI
jgi:hypothetical protein